MRRTSGDEAVAEAGYVEGRNERLERTWFGSGAEIKLKALL
jgi:hypothetical protein